MDEERWQSLLDVIEQQERDVAAMKADYAKLKGASLAHEMFIHAMMTVLAERGVLRADDMSVVIGQQIAAVEKSDMSGIRKHAADHLQLLLRNSLVLPQAHKPRPQ